MGCELTDVELIIEQKADITRVYVEDLRSVGGPMGSERVTTIYNQTFENKDVAVAFATLLVARALDGRFPPDKINSITASYEREFNKAGKCYRDCGAIGVGIHYTITEVVTGLCRIFLPPRGTP